VLDILVSIAILLFAPFLIWFVKRKARCLFNSMAVLLGIKTWVSYSPEMKEININLPSIKNGVLSPASIFEGKLVPEKLEKINLIYAKDYRISTDLTIILKSMHLLGD
jgi:hypothetical protein